MRNAIAIGVLGAALTGCGESAEQAAGGLGAQIDLGRQAQANVLLSQMRQQIAAFEAANGRNPESLDELGERMRIPDAPRGLYWKYDPDTGQVVAAKTP